MGGGWEGEVVSAANRNIGPSHPALSPRPAGGEGREKSTVGFFRTALRIRGRVRVGAAASQIPSRRINRIAIFLKHPVGLADLHCRKVKKAQPSLSSSNAAARASAMRFEEAVAVALSWPARRAATVKDSA